MKYEEYLHCARKHLDACRSLLVSYQQDERYDKQVWLDLYYLSGYILEGLTIYSAYKLYGWEPNEDIKMRYNIDFTDRTGLDFYYVRKIRDSIIFPNRDTMSLSVQGHHFQDIVENLLKQNPSFEGTPYFGNGELDIEVETLIKEWKPEVRYYYEGCSHNLPKLNSDVIAKLILTCNTIYSKHI